MAVTDLWYHKGDPERPTKRCGRGLRYRVKVAGHPSKSFRTKTPAVAWEAKLLVDGPPTPQSAVTVGELLDSWLAGKAHLTPNGLAAVKLAARAVRPRWATRSPST